MELTTETWQNIKNDLIGGLTVAFVALPLALSFGVMSGAGATAGVYGAIFTGILASIFGGTKAQISGPTGAMTVVMVEMFNKYGIDGLMAAMVFAGLIQVLMGMFKLGKYIRLIPKPTIIGFTNGIGILIFLKQLQYLKESPLLAMITILLMVFIPFMNKKLPNALIALIIGTMVSYFWLPSSQLVGEISAVVPKLNLPNFSSLNYVDILKASFLLALLGSLESLLASLVVDEMTLTKHNSDREIIGQGLANFVSAIFGNLIGTGAIVRSAVNVNAGGRGRLSGIVHGIVLLLLVIKFGKFAATIPLAVLGGILAVTSIKMIEYRETRQMASVSREAMLVIIVTTILTVFTDLTIAVALGTFLSAIILLKNLGSSYLKEYDVDCTGLTKRIKSYTIEGTFFFGVTDSIADAVEIGSSDGDIIIINLMNAPVIDATGIMALKRLNEKLEAAGKKLILTGLKREIYVKLLKLRIIGQKEKSVCLGRIAHALAYAREYAVQDNERNKLTISTVQ